MSDPKVKSLHKALQVFECFLEGESLKSVSEIAQKLDLPKSSVSNILSTFTMLDWLEADKLTGRYKLGLRALEMSNRTYQTNDIRKIMQRHLDALAKVTHEEVLLAVPRDYAVVYIGMAFAEDKGPVRRYVIGSRAPMYCTAIGKAMLLDAEDDQLQKVCVQGMVSFTETTITDLQRLKEDLEESRKRKYCIDNMEHEYGIRCVGVPIRNMAGEIVASISISGPSLRMPDSVLEDYAQKLLEVSATVKRYLIS